MNMTEDLSKFIVIFAISILVTIVTIAIIVVIIRWILRINVIVELLEKIYLNLSYPLVKCDGCNSSWSGIQMSKIDSGQQLCPDCLSKFKPENKPGSKK